MTLVDFIIVAILVILVGTACFYIWKGKKSGKKCIGCPCSGSSSGCSCKGSAKTGVRSSSR